MPRSFLRPLRVLIADPSEAFREGVIRWAADRTDLVVVGKVRSGPEAMDAVDRLSPDLVLVDAVLPGVDGFRIVRSLKSRPSPPLAVILAFVATSVMRSEALAAGADGFVPKDDFTASFERLLAELVEGTETREPAVRSRRRSVPRESRIARDP